MTGWGFWGGRGPLVGGAPAVVGDGVVPVDLDKVVVHRQEEGARDRHGHEPYIVEPVLHALSAVGAWSSSTSRMHQDRGPSAVGCLAQEAPRLGIQEGQGSPRGRLTWHS
eukprot:4955845-Pyramimonas_sp.AAC.1